MAYTPTARKIKSSPDNFAGLQNDANRVAMTGALGNIIYSQDATTIPVTSPATVSTTLTLTVPQGAVQVLICSVANAVQVSEDSTQTAYFSLPAGIPTWFDCANQQYVYLKTAASTVVNFTFKVI